MSTVTRIDRYAGSSTFSIFGQIEEVVATAMIAEGKGRLIPLEEFPPIEMCPECHYNEFDQKAKFAVMMSKHEEFEFDNRVALLRM